MGVCVKHGRGKQHPGHLKFKMQQNKEGKEKCQNVKRLVTFAWWNGNYLIPDSFL